MWSEHAGLGVHMGAKPCVGSYWSPQLRIWGVLRAMVDGSHHESPQRPGVGPPSQGTAKGHPFCQ